MTPKADVNTLDIRKQTAVIPMWEEATAGAHWSHLLIRVGFQVTAQGGDLWKSKQSPSKGQAERDVTEPKKRPVWIYELKCQKKEIYT